MITTPEGHALGCIPSVPDDRDFRYRPTLLYSDPRALPAHIDLRDYGYPRPVQNQGSLGSCTAFSAASAFQCVQKKQGVAQFDPSELALYYMERADMGTVNSDSGASIRESMVALQKYGLAPESDWPYNVSQFTQKPPQSAYDHALQHQLLTYLAVPQDVESIKACLAERFPVVFGFGVYESFERAPCSTTGWVPMPAAGEKLLGGHANHIIGYTESERIFIAQNSWGAGFGAAGFMYFSYDFIISPKYTFDLWTLRATEGPTPTPVPPTPVPPKPPAPVAADYVETMVTTLAYKSGKSRKATTHFTS